MQVITTHLGADFDSLGAMVAARKLFPEARLVFPGSQDKNVREFLTPERKSRFRFLKLKEIDPAAVDSLVVVDTRKRDRLGPLGLCLENPGVTLHIFDHHPADDNDMKADRLIATETGATCTLFVQLFRKDGVTVDAEEATVMLLGIYEDTGSLTFPGTTAADLQAAAWLLEQGASLATVARFTSHQLSSHQVSLLDQLIRSLVLYPVQGIEIPVARLVLSHYEDEFSLLVHRLADMENLDAIFCLVSMEGRIHLIARSRVPEINAAVVAKDLGGNGHASAAAATLRDTTMAEAEEMLLESLHHHIRPRTTARDMMSSPAISVPPSLPIHEANRILTLYNITVLPVVDESGRVGGIISRLVVEKAIHHGLGEAPVSDYMTTDVATLPPEAPLAAILTQIVDRRQRFVPVIDNGVLLGVITRTDLLGILVHDPATMPSELLDPRKRPSTERNKNMFSLLVERLDRATIVLLRQAGEIAADMGFRAYIVGGFVRDLILHVENHDLDIVVEGDGIDFAKRLAAALGRRVNTHPKFNTAVIKHDGGRKIDVTTARLEYYDHPAAMPTVERASIKRDLFRRDFTINALAIHINPDRFGILVDFFNCQNDIREERIRILHNLSFVEDPTRVFRAIRFEQRLGFTIGEHTARLMKNAIRLHLMDRVAGKRFFEELKLILSEKNPVAALGRMVDFDVFRLLWPGKITGDNFWALLQRVATALAWHRLLFLASRCEGWLAYLLAILASSSPQETEEFCLRLELPEKTRRFLTRQKLLVDKALSVLMRQPSPPASRIFLLLEKLADEGLVCLMALADRETVSKAVSLHVTKLRSVTTELCGDDLKRMGYPAGPLYQKILAALRAAKLDGRATGREGEIAFVQKHFPREQN